MKQGGNILFTSGLLTWQGRFICEGTFFPMTKRNIIVIATSAGGVDALCELTKHLPKDLDASVFVVMHVGAESLLPQILGNCGKLPALAAENNKHYQRGCIYVAPPHSHLSLKD